MMVHFVALSPRAHCHYRFLRLTFWYALVVAQALYVGGDTGRGTGCLCLGSPVMEAKQESETI